MGEPLALIVDPGPEPARCRVRDAAEEAGLRVVPTVPPAAAQDVLVVVSGRAALLRARDLKALLAAPGDACALYPSHQWVGVCGVDAPADPVAVRLRAGLLRVPPETPSAAVAHLRSIGRPVQAVVASDPQAAMLVRDAVDLAVVEAVLRRRRMEALLTSGVSVLDVDTTYVDPAARVAADVRLLPFTVIEGACEIGPGCRIGPGTHLRESRLAAGVRVWYSVIEESTLGAACTVGPYAHLRPGCRVGEGVHVGNFVELKNAQVGDGAKLPHHTYMGEVDIGPEANVGAGAVVVNYDGVKKRRAGIGARVMLGCNANLIAPARVADDGFVAAGSTVTEDVPSDALCIGRARQTIVPGWVPRHHAAPPS